MIEISNLRFSYKGQKQLFNDVSVCFQPGYIHTLVGRNGEGKTTLFKLINGLLKTKQSDGRVCVAGKNASNRTKSLLEDTYLLTEETCDTALSIAQYRSAYSPFYPKFSAERFEYYVEQFQIDINKSLKKCSLGQKKRAMLAFALATQVSYLLLDEPTNGLDIESKGALRQALSQYVDEDRLVIVSTHNIREIDLITDYLAVLREGQILLHANTIDLAHSFYVEHNSGPSTNPNLVFEEQVTGGMLALIRKQPDVVVPQQQLDLELVYRALIANPDAF